MSFMDLNGPFKMLQGHTPVGVTPFWGPLQAACLQKADDIYYHEVVHLFTKRCFLEANQPFWREGGKTWTRGQWPYRPAATMGHGNWAKDFDYSCCRVLLVSNFINFYHLTASEVTTASEVKSICYKQPLWPMFWCPLALWLHECQKSNRKELNVPGSSCSSDLNLPPIDLRCFAAGENVSPGM